MMTKENVIKMREMYKDRGFFIISAGYGARFYNEIALQGAFLIWDDTAEVVHAVRSDHENYLQVGIENKTQATITTLSYEDIESFCTHVSGAYIENLVTQLGADVKLVESIKKFY